MLQVYSGNQVAFFEIAATLIPILLFGGVVADRVGPTGSGQQRLMQLGMVVAFVGGYAILAEVAAINVVITGEPTLLAEILTMTFLFGGMIGVVAALVQPWYSTLRKGTEARWRAWVLAAVTGAILVMVSMTALGATVLGLDRAEEDQFSAARSAKITQMTTEEAAVRSRILALQVAGARVTQQAAAALSRGDTPVVLGSFADEKLTLEKMLVAEKKMDRGLVRAIAELRDQELRSAPSESPPPDALRPAKRAP